MDKSNKSQLTLRIPAQFSNFRKDGEWFREEFIVKQWNKVERFIFDFENRPVASVSFLDEVFAKLFLEFKPEEVIRKLYRFERMVPMDKELLKEVINTRLLEVKFKNKLNKKNNKVTARVAQR
ncbi:MAG TPA: hypothetical protein DCX95_01640 [Elusimicrobia bacterium]|nr:hypothetical protein [Elusimicrobiota bacterium]